MKLMTLNSHSLEEPDYESKLLTFVEAVVREQPDIIALQEVNQRSAAAVLKGGLTFRFGPEVTAQELEGCGFVPCPEGSAEAPIASPADQSAIPVRADNHAFRAAGLLSRRGMPYHWTWISSKIGYDKYDEGLALFSRYPIQEARQFYISASRDYTNWRTRKILGITVDTGRDIQHFFTAHMGWWADKQEPFAGQWQRACKALDGRSGQIWILGDFNSPAHIPGQGYDLIRAGGWLDTYQMAADRDSGVTVDRAIDGWKQYPSPSGMRIDHIWTNRKIPVKSSQVMFNGRNDPIVSDHFGVMIEIAEGADI